MQRMLTLALLLCAGATAATPPVDHFTRHADYEQARISPTGEYLAVTTKADDREFLTIVELAGNKVLYRTDFGKNWDVADFQWATSERILVQPGRRLPGWSDFYYQTREIYALNADGSDARAVFGPEVRVRRPSGSRTLEWPQLLHLLPDEPRHVLIGTVPYSAGKRPGCAYRLDIHTGDLELVTTGRYYSSRFVADLAGEPRFEIGQTDENVTEVYHLRPDGTDRLVSKGRVNEGVIFPLAEDRDGWFFALDNADTATSRLVRWQPESGEKETLFHEPSVDIDGPVLDPAGRLVAVRYSKHYPDYHYVDPDSNLAATHRRIRAAFPNEDLRLTSLTRDGSKGVVVVYGDRFPATFYLAELDTGRIVELFQSRPWLASEDLNPMEPVELNTRDGTVVHGYLTTPAGWAEGDPLPLIVLIHGGPHGVRDYWGFDPEAQLFSSRGFAVLQVNYRGSGGYGKLFLHSGYGRWGREMQDDVTDATRWAVSAGIADPERLCIYGASYGGYSALTGAFREPDLYRCAVGYVGVYDLDMMFRKGDIPDRRAGLNYLKEAVGEDREELRARSPAHNAERIKAAVMLVHGGRDQRVPIAQARALRQALKAAGRPVEVWHVEPREGHGFGSRDNRREMYTEMLAFYDRHIGRGADGSTRRAN